MAKLEEMDVVACLGAAVGYFIVAALGLFSLKQGLTSLVGLAKAPGLTGGSLAFAAPYVARVKPVIEGLFGKEFKFGTTDTLLFALLIVAIGAWRTSAVSAQKVATSLKGGGGEDKKKA